MLMMSMLAGASGLFLLSAAPQDCAAQQNIVPVSLTPSVPDAPKEGGKLPGVTEKDRDPAVLLPKCKTEPRTKRKKRLSDYPMA
jgi:hypothetical protein